MRARNEDDDTRSIRSVLQSANDIKAYFLEYFGDSDLFSDSDGDSDSGSGSGSDSDSDVNISTKRSNVGKRRQKVTIKRCD